MYTYENVTYMYMYNGFKTWSGLPPNFHCLNVCKVNFLTSSGLLCSELNLVECLSSKSFLVALHKHGFL